MPEVLAVSAKVDALEKAMEAKAEQFEKRADRRDKEVNREHSTLWDALEKMRERLDRLPVWATMMIGILTGLVGTFGGWIAKSIFN